MQSLSYRIAIPILLTAVCLEARWEDRLYPFIELTDEMRARIDLKDGSVEDWLEVLGEPTLTPLDFLPPPSLPGYDPSSYDFRIWLAWHASTDHLFVAAEFVDDYHVSVYDHNDPNSLPIGDSSVWFFVDGDRSGGGLIQPGEPDLNHMIQAQWYAAIARTYSNDSNVQLYLPEVAPGIRTVTLGGSNPSTEGLETWENDVASPPNSRPKSPWRPWSATRRWPSSLPSIICTPT